MEPGLSPVLGDLLREWRNRRRLSQLALACEAEVSQRHLSFLESGRATPSRAMLERLCRQMDIPLREQNRIYVCAGFAPIHTEKPLDHPALAPAINAVEQVLKGHEPYPALAVDGQWRLVLANATAGKLTGLASNPSLLEPPINVLRLSLHPEGLAPHIVNLAEWRGHLLHRLRRQIDTTASAQLAALESELRAYPSPASPPPTPPTGAGIVVPLRLRLGTEILAFISTVTVFGAPNDITLSELALETFFPADAQTGAALRAMVST